MLQVEKHVEPAVNTELELDVEPDSSVEPLALSGPLAESDSPELSLRRVQRALGNLGHNALGDIAYTSVTLDNTGIITIDPLSNFPFLQRISLDDNRLTTLAPLQSLESLVYLSATNNQLSEDGVFPFVASSASSLERLQLDGNRLTSLRGLGQLSFLTDLSVCHNQITALEEADFIPLKCLTRFSATNNHISVVVPNIFAGPTQIRLLDLSHNTISDLRFVAHITESIGALMLSHNRIATLEGSPLSWCAVMGTLDVSHNLLPSVEELCALCPVRLLRFLLVVGNPFWAEEVSTSGGGDCDGDDTSSSRAASSDGSSWRKRGTVTSDGEEVVIRDAADLESAAGFQKSASAAALVPPAPALDYTALAAPSAYGIVRHVLTAGRMAAVPWRLDRAKELGHLRPTRQVLLRLLFLLPFLAEVNDRRVGAHDVARAKFFFAPEAE